MRCAVATTNPTEFPATDFRSLDTFTPFSTLPLGPFTIKTLETGRIVGPTVSIRALFTSLLFLNIDASGGSLTGIAIGLTVTAADWSEDARTGFWRTTAFPDAPTQPDGSHAIGPPNAGVIVVAFTKFRLPIAGADAVN